MNIPEEAARVFPDGEYTSHGVNAALREAFSMGAEWARKEALREAEDALIGNIGNVEGWVGPTEEIGAHYSSVRDGLIMALETVRDVRMGVSDGQQ